MPDSAGVTYEDIRLSVERGQPKETEKLVRKALAEGLLAEEIVNRGMVEAMRLVGQRYRNNEIYIPGILAASRAMREGVAVLEPEMEEAGQRRLGTIILGTVEGDLHDMGKNLVAMMFRCAGFEVIDLGVDVSDKQFLAALREHPQTSIVCISTLLTTAMPGMQQVVKSIRQSDRERQIKIMVGGAPVTQAFADAIGADAYTENAVDAAEKARSFIL